MLASEQRLVGVGDRVEVRVAEQRTPKLVDEPVAQVGRVDGRD